MKFWLPHLQPLLFPCPKSNFDTTAVNIRESLSKHRIIKFQITVWKSKHQPCTWGFPLLFKVSCWAGPKSINESFPTTRTVRNSTRLQNLWSWKSLTLGKTIILLWILSSLSQTWTWEDRHLEVPYSFRTRLVTRWKFSLLFSGLQLLCITMETIFSKYEI